MVIVIFLLLSVQASVHSGWRRAVYDETFVAEVSTDSKKQTKKRKRVKTDILFQLVILFVDCCCRVFFFLSLRNMSRKTRFAGYSSFKRCQLDRSFSACFFVDTDILRNLRVYLRRYLLQPVPFFLVLSVTVHED